MVTHVQVMHAYNLRIQWVETGGSGIHAILDHIASLRLVGDTGDRIYRTRQNRTLRIYKFPAVIFLLIFYALKNSNL